MSSVSDPLEPMSPAKWMGRLAWGFAIVTGVLMAVMMFAPVRPAWLMWVTIGAQALSLAAAVLAGLCSRR